MNVNRVFSVSNSGCCHAVAHSLGGKYHIFCGLANSVLLTYVQGTCGESARKSVMNAKVLEWFNHDVMEEE